MSRDMNDLAPAFRQKAEELLQTLSDRGVPMYPFFTLRHPLEQARLWRQSRSKHEIDQAIADLRAEKADYIADRLEEAGPQDGPWVTNALPGNSWHQYGEAIDCFWAIDLDGNGVVDACWDTERTDYGVNGYREYARYADTLGLTPGATFDDWPHVQARPASSPYREGMTWDRIDAVMKERFG